MLSGLFYFRGYEVILVDSAKNLKSVKYLFELSVYIDYHYSQLALSISLTWAELPVFCNHQVN